MAERMKSEPNRTVSYFIFKNDNSENEIMLKIDYENEFFELYPKHPDYSVAFSDVAFYLGGKRTDENSRLKLINLIYDAISFAKEELR